VLVVGCGAGVTAGRCPAPGVERIVVCEIESLIPKVAARYFERENHSVLADQRTRVVLDDARHYIFTTQDRFDVITSDPIHPWVERSRHALHAGVLRVVQRRLNPGGVIPSGYRCMKARSTLCKRNCDFLRSLSGGHDLANDTILEEGYDVVLLARPDGMKIDVDDLQQRLDRADHEPVAKSLREVGFSSR